MIRNELIALADTLSRYAAGDEYQRHIEQAETALRAAALSSATPKAEDMCDSKLIEASNRGYAQGLADGKALSSTTPAGGGLREFEEWLNERRMHDVSFVFHDIVAKYAAALAASPVPMSDTGAQEVNLIECGCGDMYRHDTYGAGYIDAIGKCQNCAAADASQPPQSAPQDAQSDLLKLIAQRDQYHDWADDLAAQIAEITGDEIGEHSSANNPWHNAIEAAKMHVQQRPDVPQASQSAPGDAVAWNADRKTDQAVTKPFCDWLDTVRHCNGVGANEAWNAGVAWATTHSAPVVGMTDDEIDGIVDFNGYRSAAGGIYATSVYDFARAIEAALREKAGGEG